MKVFWKIFKSFLEKLEKLQGQDINFLKKKSLTKDSPDNFQSFKPVLFTKTLGNCLYLKTAFT